MPLFDDNKVKSIQSLRLIKILDSNLPNNYNKEQLDKLKNVIQVSLKDSNEEEHQQKLQYFLSSINSYNSPKENTPKVSLKTNLPLESDNSNIATENFQQLLQDQKDIQTKELEIEKQAQKSLLIELSELTNALKHTTIDINSSVVNQNEQLNMIKQFADDNERELDYQKKKMNERTKSMTRSLWGNIGITIWIVLLFVLVYIFIRLFPKPIQSDVCYKA